MLEYWALHEHDVRMILYYGCYNLFNQIAHSEVYKSFIHLLER